MSSKEEALLKQIAELKESLFRVQLEYAELKGNEFLIDVTDGNLPTEGPVWELMEKHVLDNTYVNEIFNTNTNWPTEGTFWELMKEHVLDNTDDDEKLEYIDGESVRNTWELGELYDKVEIVEHIRKNNIPPEAIYTSTQLSHSSEIVNKELLADYKKICEDKERIRVKYNELLIEHRKLVSKDKVLELDNEIIVAEMSKYKELVSKLNKLVDEHIQIQPSMKKKFVSFSDI